VHGVGHRLLHAAAALDRYDPAELGVDTLLVLAEKGRR
jgi:hypothetical protein